MEENNYVISTSMLQYIEQMDSYLKNNNTLKTEAALLPEASINFLQNNFNLDQPQEDFNIEFEPDRMLGNLEIRGNQEMEIEEDVKSNYTDYFAVHDGKLGFDKIENNSQEEVSSKDSSENKKPKLSNKERARRARQRKKKYYDDLENRVKYLEGKCENMAKELDYCKNKLAIYEDKSTDGSVGTFDSLDNKIFERMEDYIKCYKGDEVNLQNAIDNVHDQYGPFGQEKIKLLEKSFDNFLENILTGAHFKLSFYVFGKEFPKNYTEYQKYSRLKKFQQHEKYPDEHIREFLKAKRKCLETREGFNNFVKNKVPIVLDIKKQMKEAISKLFEAKNMIFKALMQCDIYKLLYPNIKMTKADLIELLHEHKHSNFKVSYKEALDIVEENVQEEAVMNLPNPNSYKKIRIKQYGFSEEDHHPKFFKQTFSYRKLTFKE